MAISSAAQARAPSAVRIRTPFVTQVNTRACGADSSDGIIHEDADTGCRIDTSRSRMNAAPRRSWHHRAPQLVFLRNSEGNRDDQCAAG
jgi:hypothetical protein